MRFGLDMRVFGGRGSAQVLWGIGGYGRDLIIMTVFGGEHSGRLRFGGADGQAIGGRKVGSKMGSPGGPRWVAMWGRHEGREREARSHGCAETTMSVLTLNFEGWWWLYRIRGRSMGAARVADGTWVLAGPARGGWPAEKRRLEAERGVRCGWGEFAWGASQGGGSRARLRGGPQ